MKINAKSFPVFLYLLMLVLCFNPACRSTSEKVIGKKQFIEIYARVLIIDEMDLPIAHKERLRDEVMQQNKITRDDIDRTIEYYNSRPEEWIDVLGKTRDRIEQLRTNKLTYSPP